MPTGNQYDILKRALTRTQCRMARYGLELTTIEFAKLAKVSPDTISRLERGDARLKDRTLEDIRRTLEKHGVQFLDANGGPPGVRLATQKPRGKAK